MAGLCTSLRLLSGTRLHLRLSSQQANRTIRSFSTSICSQHRDGLTHLPQRPTALPKESREPASQPHHQRRAASVLADNKDSSNVATDEAWLTKKSPDGIPDLNVEYINIGDNPGRFHPVFLRDACTCSHCVDPSSTQKQFQTADIPATIRAKSVKIGQNGDAIIEWQNDIPSFGPNHVSTYPSKFIDDLSTTSARLRARSDLRTNYVRLWNGRRIFDELQFVDFNDYMNKDESLFRALMQLERLGLLLLRNVPESEDSVAQLAGRIGTIRDTFYGKTWDVKSVPKAKNVAYTHQSLGLHMDLMYMADPPGFQLLHCLKNTCEGGNSLFSDSWYATTRLVDKDFETLSTMKLAYHYRNAGEHYYYERPLIETVEHQHVYSHVKAKQTPALKCVNYSPPFQAPIPIPMSAQGFLFPRLAHALRNFTKAVESPLNLYEYRLQEGDCVMFNNRRVLHGRREFESGNGERWLKGAYIDTDVFRSKWRTLNEKFKGTDIGAERLPHVNPEAWDKLQIAKSKAADAETE